VGLLLYVVALGAVEYQSASACAVSAVVEGDPRYTGRLQWMPARYECTWLDLPGAPSTTATGVDLAALSVLGGVLFLVCAVALIVISPCGLVEGTDSRTIANTPLRCRQATGLRRTCGAVPGAGAAARIVGDAPSGPMVSVAVR